VIVSDVALDDAPAPAPQCHKCGAQMKIQIRRRDNQKFWFCPSLGCYNQMSLDGGIDLAKTQAKKEQEKKAKLGNSLSRFAERMASIAEEKKKARRSYDTAVEDGDLGWVELIKPF
jgi:hypothetical protein